MRLLTKTLFAKLVENGHRQAAVKGTEAEIDFKPVVKLFDPCGAGTWLLTEIDPEDHDIAFGLCDLGMGCPELGNVSLSELANLRRAAGVLGIERDLYFKADKTLSAYATEASANMRIIA